MNTVSSIRQLEELSSFDRECDIEAAASNLLEERELLRFGGIVPSGTTKNRLLEYNRRKFKRLQENAAHFGLLALVQNVIEKSKRTSEITLAIRRYRDLKPGTQTGIDFYLIEERAPDDVKSEKRFTLRQVIGWLETVPDDELERMITFEYVFAFTSDGFAIDGSFIRIGGEDLDIGGCQTGYRMKPIALGQANSTNN